MMKVVEMKFPDTITNFAEELGVLCRKHKLTKFTGTFAADFFDDSARGWGDFQFVFSQGRHGNAANGIQIICTKRMNKLLPPRVTDNT